MAIPKLPVLFSKSISSITGTGESIVIPICAQGTLIYKKGGGHCILASLISILIKINPTTSKA